MYKKARKGEIEQLTAVSASFEEPTIADIVVDMENSSLEDWVKQVLQVMQIEKPTISDMIAEMKTAVLDSVFT
jgi:adenylylsulfate kinase-like enzyme